MVVNFIKSTQKGYNANSFLYFCKIINKQNYGY